MADQTIEARLVIKDDGSIVIQRIGKGLDETAKKSKKAQSALQAFGKSIVQGIGQGIGQRVFDTLTRSVNVATDAIIDSTLAAIEWEDAFAGVRKTLDATPAQFDKINRGLVEMSERLPISSIELAGVAEAAGTLGVAADDVLTFTGVVAGVGIASNVTAEEAAVAFARIDNIVSEGRGEFDRLGSALIDLGNNTATTEDQIIAMATRIAGAAEVVGLSRGELLGFSAAVSETGASAERGGTAIAKTFRTMATAVATGSEELEVFAKVAGVTVDDFSSRFRDDAAQAMLVFLDGLGQIPKGSAEAFQALEQLGLADERVQGTLLTLAASADRAAAAIERGNEAYAANTALAEEVAKRNETARSELIRFDNAASNLAVDLGNNLLPAVAEFARVMRTDLFPILRQDLADFQLGESLKSVARDIAQTGVDFVVGIRRELETIKEIASFIANNPILSTLFGPGIAGKGAAGAGGGIMHGLGITKLDLFLGALGGIPGFGLITQPILGERARRNAEAMEGPGGGFLDFSLKTAAGRDLSFVPGIEGKFEQLLAEGMRVAAESPLSVPDSTVRSVASRINDAFGALVASAFEAGLGTAAGKRLPGILGGTATFSTIAPDFTQLQMPGIGTMLGAGFDQPFADPLIPLGFIEGAIPKIDGVLGGIKESREATIDWSRALMDLANQMEVLGPFGSIVAQIAGGIASAGAAVQSLTTSVSEGGLSGATGLGGFIGRVTAGMSIAGAAIGVGKAIFSLFGSDPVAQAADEVGKITGATISASLAEELAEQSEATGLGMFETTLLNIVAIAQDAGQPLSAFTDQIGDLMNAVALGAVPAAAGIEELGSAFTMLAEEAASGSSAALASMVEMIQRTRELGLEVPEIQAAIERGVQQAVTGAGQLFGNLDAIELSAESAGAIFSSTFWAAFRTMGPIAALEAMQPSFEALQERFADIGAEGALGGIPELFGLMTEEMQPILEVSNGLLVNLQGMASAGFVTAEAFQATQEGAVAAFDALIEGGASSEAAFAVIAPLLAEIQKTAQAYGLAIDPATQSLIDQANALGQFPVDPLLRVVEVLEAIARKLGADIPAAVGEANAALGNLNVPNVGGGGFVPPDVPGFAHGGIHTSPTLAMVGDSYAGAEVTAPVAALFEGIGSSLGQTVGQIVGEQLTQLAGLMASRPILLRLPNGAIVEAVQDGLDNGDLVVPDAARARRSK